MIITKIRLQEQHPMATSLGTWPLPFCDLNLDASAGENGYLIKNSVGLGPPDITAVVDGFDSSGIPIMDSVSHKREMVFRIGLTPKLGQSVSALRDEIYKFMSKELLISLMDESLTIATTHGYIRQFETLHFSKQPEIQITIECDEGYFSAPFPVPIPLDTLNTLQPIINYEGGTAPTGFDLQFTYTAIADGTGFVIFNYSRIWHPHSYDHARDLNTGSLVPATVFEVTYPLITDDVVTISTHPSMRRITLERGENTFDLGGYLNAGAVWPKLHSGVNVFDWDFDASWMEWNSASYIPRYWGV